MTATLLPLIATFATQFPVIDAGVYAPLSASQGKADCLLFVMRDCPIGNATAPEYRRIALEYGPKGVRFFVAFSEPGLTAQDAKRHAEAYGLRMTSILDPDSTLAAKYGATRSPEAVLILPGGGTVYRGRIDDLYAKLGTRRPKAIRRDLRLALDEVLAGKAVTNPTTEVVGCILPSTNRPAIKTS